MDNNSSNEKSNEIRNQQDEVTANYAERESWIRTSVTFKMFSIAFLAIILLIPAFMIQMVIQDREYRRNEAVQEISSKWGNEQTLAGPILTVPYKATIKDEAGNISNVTHNPKCAIGASTRRFYIRVNCNLAGSFRSQILMIGQLTNKIFYGTKPFCR